MRVRRSKREVDVPGLLMALGMEFREHGGEYWARCPNHPEKTASWSISDSGAHHCFGCKWQGGALDLVMKVIKFQSFHSARAWIEERGLYSDGAVPLAVNLEMKRPDSDTRMDFPIGVRIRPLSQWITPAKRYAKQRGVTAAQVDQWGLGYAAGGWYANRLILPTRARDGTLLNVTGRAWSPTKTPKYLNAKESHGWQPGAVFGEQYWPMYPSRATLVVCEGELNALACERVGAEYVGALGGSQLEKEQVLKLSQFKRIVLAVDMDQAGSLIAKQLRATLVRWRRVRVVDFPDERDPNDLELQEPEILRGLLCLQ